MAKQKMKTKGPEAFEAHYQQAFGARWQALKAALLVDNPKHILLSPFGERPNHLTSDDGIHFLNNIFPHSELELDNFQAYYMDGASALPLEALELSSGDELLDLCAAPGGKSLYALFACGGDLSLTCNELSRNRRERLKRNLELYIPKKFHENIKVTGYDGSTWCLHEQEAYEKILLDAPCSSERHVLTSKTHLDQWSLKRVKRLAARQWALLASAYIVLKPGGLLVYSTCALLDEENDLIVEKLISKKGARVSELAFPWGEPTKYGWRVLPDTDQGLGPFYLALIQKPLAWPHAFQGF